MQAEDFLYHLYRGTELLQGDRVHEAKEELESALRLSPQDPKSQDLLGVVYFRLGLYPRAIQIFDDLVRSHPGQRTPKINLALCYLKTAQLHDARGLLEQVVASHPSDTRAWGYLGLSYERLGDLDKAREAYLRGGHGAKARRLDDASSPRSSMDPMSQIRGELASLPPIDGGEAVGAIPPQSAVPGEARPLPLAADLARAVALVPPKDRGASQIAEGWVSVSLGKRFACRLDALRTATGVGSWDASPLVRRARGLAGDEPLGGRAAPLCSFHGGEAVMLGPRPGFRLTAVRLGGEPLVVREDVLTALGDVEYESTLLGVGGGEGVVVVRIRGEGFVVLETPGGVASVEVVAPAVGLFPADVLVGFLGDLEPRYLAESEAPGRYGGLIEVRGAGFVLLDAR